MKIKIPCCCSVAEGECNRVWPHDTASGHWVNSQRLFSPRGFHDSSTDSRQHEPMLSHLQLNIYCHDWGSPTNCGDVMSCSCKTLHSKTIRSKCAEQSCSCGVYMIKCSADSLLCSQADQNTIKKKKSRIIIKMCIFAAFFKNTQKQNLPLNQHFKASLQDKNRNASTDLTSGLWAEVWRDCEWESLRGWTPLTACASENRGNELLLQNNSRLKPPPRALLSVRARSCNKKRESVRVRIACVQPPKPGPSVSEQGGPSPTPTPTGSVWSSPGSETWPDPGGEQSR